VVDQFTQQYMVNTLDLPLPLAASRRRPFLSAKYDPGDDQLKHIN
jgi:hypothetical protein